MSATEGLGLLTDVAKSLAAQTLVGAGTMLAQWSTDAKSFKAAGMPESGTTAAGLAQFDHEVHWITDLVQRTLAASTSRSSELGYLA